MIPSIRARIESLWFERGTAADAALAVNKHIARLRWLSPTRIRKLWRNAQRDGRLPPIERPNKGWSEDQLRAIQALKVTMGRAA